MKPTGSETEKKLTYLSHELENLNGIVKGILPLAGEIPLLTGFDIYGATMPLNGVVGGDHLIYVDFKQRYDLHARIEDAIHENRPDIIENLDACKKRAGIVLIDVSGHQATDAVLAGMLHQAFLMGAIYELDTSGQITSRLFEHLNTRFYSTSSIDKYLTMIYGEISEDATFRFLSAAHPLPVVFSNKHNRFMEISKDLCTSFPPIGTIPSGNLIDQKIIKSVLGFKGGYKINEWKIIGRGDILLLYTDGLLEHSNPEKPYFPDHLEQIVREVKHEKARTIWDAISNDLLHFNKPSDDISFVVIKRM
jgi:serine phosphatase RsbU (regulator of sigma subunit)